MEHSVLNYSDAVEFLRATFEEKRKRNPRFSLRAWSRQLGIQNPASLSRIFQGKRPLGPDLAKKIADKLEFSSVRDREYFQFLAIAKTNGIDTSILASSPHDERTFENLTPDQFNFISEWHHLAILEMVSLSDFQNDPSWISDRLGGRISAEHCQEALNRLVRLGLVTVSSAGIIKRASDATLQIKGAIPSEVIRSFHRQTILKALDSVDHQMTETRTLTTATVGIRNADLEKARRIITKAHEELTALSRNTGNDEVFQLSTQFFQVTQPSHAPQKETKE